MKRTKKFNRPVRKSEQTASNRVKASRFEAAKRWFPNSFNDFVLFVLFLYLYILLFLYVFIFKNVYPLELFNVEERLPKGINTIPFYTIRSYLAGVPGVPMTMALINVFGNILFFMPLGIYLQLIRKNKNIFINILIPLVVSVCIEFLQLKLRLGAFDVDDIILNFLGGLLGIFVYRILYNFLKDEDKVRSAIVFWGLILSALTFVALMIRIIW